MSKALEYQDIFLFVPNQIGFLRIVLALLSFYFMAHNAVMAVTAYIGSQLLDAVDGFAARYFNQCSKFGAILDQVTDRCTFLGLLLCLCAFYPDFAFCFQVVAIVDISCHWAHLHSSLLLGKSSHKTEQENPVLHVYYSNKWVLFVLCASNELFFLSLYLLNFSTDSRAVLVCCSTAALTAPFMIVKMGISLIQGVTACRNIAAIDALEVARASCITHEKKA